MTSTNPNLKNRSIQRDLTLDHLTSKAFDKIPIYPFGKLPVAGSTNARQGMVAFEQQTGAGVESMGGLLKFYNGVAWESASGTGDVVGPASSTDNAIARFDGITGKLIQNSLATISDTGVITATNISGTNTGDVTLAAVDSAGAANVNGAFLTGQVLNLRSASTAGPGVMTTGTQSIAGAKTFTTTLALPHTTAAGATGVFFMNTTPFFHDFSTSGSVKNVFLGGAGNFTAATTTASGSNIGIGAGALAGLTTGPHNIGIGVNAFAAMTTGFGNIGIGNSTGAVATSGNGNIFIGLNAGDSLTAASNNIGIGANTLSALTTGASNTVVGVNAGTNLETGQSNVIIGSVAGASLAGAESDNILIANSGVLGESNTTRVGTGSQTRTFISGVYNITPAVANPGFMIIDSSSQLGSSFNLAMQNTNTGGTAGLLTIGSTRLHNYSSSGTAANKGIYLGNLAGNLTTTSIGNVGIGNSALAAVTTGSNNTALGLNALAALTTGATNTAIGASALSSLTTGSTNVSLGGTSSLTTGSGNTMVGQASGSAYTGAESNNILIKSAGVVADSGAIRIGTAGTHTTTFVTGIADNVTPAVLTPVVVNPATHQLTRLTEFPAAAVTTSAGGITAASFASGTSAPITFSGPLDANTFISAAGSVLTALRDGLFIARIQLSVTEFNDYVIESTVNGIDNDASYATAVRLPTGAGSIAINTNFIAELTAGDTWEFDVFGTNNNTLYAGPPPATAPGWTGGLISKVIIAFFPSIPGN